MRISDILRDKGSDVVTVHRDTPVKLAVRLLVERNIGSVVVIEDERVTGILTERDVLRLTARDLELIRTLLVDAVMTRDPITASPAANLKDVMHTMTDHRIRHLPVVDGDRLVGIVSIGDVVNACRADAEEENHHLRDYIHGVVS